MTEEAIDAARLALILTDLRLPAIKQGWSAFATRADKEGWPPPASSPPSPNTRWLSAIAAASSVTSATPDSCPERRWTPSTSTPRR
jgi:hypothetical protein